MKTSLGNPGSRFCLLLAPFLAVGAAPLGAAEVGIAATQQLSFGAFVAGTGSVTMQPSGARSTSGSVVALAGDPGQAAQFAVSGDAGATYSITLPGNGTVSLSNGSSTMPINSFVSSPGASGVLSMDGTQVLSVGATLEVSDGQPAGAYSGSFSVIVNYN